MTGSALGLVIAAAFLHAGWNALTKRGGDPLLFLWSSMLVAALGLLPFAIAVGFGPAFSGQGLPYVGGSVALHAIYFVTLSSAYRHGDFSLVYPVARGLGVALVPAIALALFDEQLSALGALGIGLVVIGIAATGAMGRAPGARFRPGSGTGWAVLTGVIIAAYSIVDRTGVRVLHPVPYLTLMSLGACLVLSPIAVGRRAQLVAEWRKNGRTILLASTMNLSGYLLVLFAYRTSKTGYVVACRELSIVLSAIIGAVLFREGRLRARLAGSLAILAGVACVALAR